MAKLSPRDKARFAEYLQEVKCSRGNLEFLLETLGHKVALDFSVESLEACEAVFWQFQVAGVDSGVTDTSHFAQLLCQYLAECVVQHVGATWIQSEGQNPMFAQPCLELSIDQPWERIYPVHIALHLTSLRTEKPNFPGVRESRVLAAKLERALAVHSRHVSKA